MSNEFDLDFQEQIHMTGKEKAAILLIALGPEVSAKIFEYLKEEEIEILTLEISNTTSVLPAAREAVLEEFYQICLAQDYIAEGGIGYAKRILEKALGENKAFDVISSLTAKLQVRPFDFIRKTDARQILNFIQNEHNQTIALILSYLPAQQAAEVLSALSVEKQADVARRIAVMDSTSPEVIKEVEKVLEKKLSAMMTEEYANVGGIDSVVEILNAVDRATEKHIMETLETEDMILSDEIRKKMFVFEDILNLDNKTVQTILRQDIDNKELAIALKGSSDELKQLIFANLSKRLASMIQEDMEFMGPIRRTDVEEAQQKIVNVIRKLQDAGEIVIASGGGDELIV
ncbi:MAG: flagellar motor switch protein FliG [Lachnospirales bacterium]